MGNTLQTTSSNQFLVKCSGGSSFFTSNTNSTGVALAAGASSWSVVSDVNKKENLVLVDCAHILNQIVDMPLYCYNYIGNPIQQCNISPTAQDFYNAFPCDTITTIVLDENGDELLDVDGNVISEERPSKNQLTIEVMDLVGNLMGCVKQLNSKIELLENRINILENP